MIASNAVDLGLIVRGARRDRGLSQAQLCADAEVSRRWLSDFEAGKSTAEVGLVFRVLHALGLVMDVSPAPAPELDLDDLLKAYGQRGRTDE